MPLFGRRRRHEAEAWSEELPDDVVVPEGMTAVPEWKIDEWTDQMVTAASEKASSQATPNFVDLYSAIALEDVCGPERAGTLPHGAGELAYNVRLHGYWCRAQEMAVLGNPEPAPAMTALLTEGHDMHQLDWFQTVQSAADTFASMSSDERQELAVLPQDGGDEFRGRLAVACITWVAAAVDAQHPGSSSLLTPDELHHCWTTGYWLRAASVSLPDDAHVEFAATEGSAD